MDWLCFAKPFHHDGWALLRNTFLNDWIGFASQSQSILMELLCVAKPIHCEGSALLRKANPSS